MENKKQEGKKEPHELPSDVLGVIAKKLDFDDLFSFGQVCKYWRNIHSPSDFMASNCPLILQKTSQAKRSCFFYSIPESRTYKTLLPSFVGFSLKGFSSGYMIMMDDHSVLLINPFIRKMIKIPKPDDPLENPFYGLQSTLAFDEANPEEFILVILNRCDSNIFVYQSNSSDWAIIYSKNDGTSRNVSNVVVYHKTVYAITTEAEIGVLMLNTRRLKFLNLQNKPNGKEWRWRWRTKLVNSNDDQLLVLVPDFEYFRTYTIDFSTMSWIKLKTLGDRSLFLSYYGNCYSLSNPNKWGFRSNCLFDLISPECRVCSMDKFIEVIAIPENPNSNSRAIFTYVDWCFRPHRDVVDYTNLIE